jgi:hypothetical protein
MGVIRAYKMNLPRVYELANEPYYAYYGGQHTKDHLRFIHNVRTAAIAEVQKKNEAGESWDSFEGRRHVEEDKKIKAECDEFLERMKAKAAEAWGRAGCRPAAGVTRVIPKCRRSSAYEHGRQKNHRCAAGGCHRQFRPRDGRRMHLGSQGEGRLPALRGRAALRRNQGRRNCDRA